jgi:hypothetical protein
MKWPLDKTPYPKDPRSTPISGSTPDGGYVYVQDPSGIIHVVPDGPHLHPKVLGGGQPAAYAGDLTIQGGKVTDVTNLSGTFEFDSEEGLKAVAGQLRQQGLVVEVGAVRFFPPNGSRPVILE